MARDHDVRAFWQDAVAGRLDRREVLRRGAALGFSATVLGAVAHLASANRLLAAEEGTLKPTFYDWIINLHRPISDVNEDFAQTFPIRHRDRAG